MLREGARGARSPDVQPEDQWRSRRLAPRYPALPRAGRSLRKRATGAFLDRRSPPRLGSTRARSVCGGQRPGTPLVPDIFSGFPPRVATLGLPGCQGRNRGERRHPRPGFLLAFRTPEASHADRDDADRPASAAYPLRPEEPDRMYDKNQLSPRLRTPVRATRLPIPRGGGGGGNLLLRPPCAI